MRFFELQNGPDGTLVRNSQDVEAQEACDKRTDLSISPNILKLMEQGENVPEEVSTPTLCHTSICSLLSFLSDVGVRPIRPKCQVPAGCTIQGHLPESPSRKTLVHQLRQAAVHRHGRGVYRRLVSLVSLLTPLIFSGASSSPSDSRARL